MNAPKPILEMINVSQTAGGKTILKDVNWQVNRGQHWTILGPNGAGKTTLLKLACGYLWPNESGEVLRLGKSQQDLVELRRSMGWVNHRLVNDIPQHEKVLDTVVTGRLGQVGLHEAWHSHKPTEADYEDAGQFLSDLDAASLSAKRFGVLSQGEQQKVLIARALMSLPLLIFLDEPCAGLDPGARERFLASIEKLASRDAAPSLVMVTHHLEEILPAFDMMMALKEGQVIAEGLVADKVTSALLTALYDRPVQEMIERDGRKWPIF